MCFSATASFVAGSALTATGAITLSKVHKKNEIPLASVPLLFGIQQIVEGFVWLSLHWSAAAQCLTTHSYLAFASILWPVLIPIAVFLVEKDKLRKRFMRIFVLIGAATGAYMLYYLITQSIVARATPDHIAYVTSRSLPTLVMVGYLLATCTVEFFSKEKMIRLLGGAVSVSLVITYLFYKTSLPSVWCFFSAILSVIVYVYFAQKYPSKAVIANWRARVSLFS